jgi:hypothetical protein
MYTNKATKGFVIGLIACNLAVLASAVIWIITTGTVIYRISFLVILFAWTVVWFVALFRKYFI